MKVYIGPFANWIGPYQIAEKLLFWMDKEDDRVGNLGDNLARMTWLCRFCDWLDSKRGRKTKIRIDPYDTWNMDSTLAHIILPMLKQLKDSKHGAPYVEDGDVPENLRSTAAGPKENEWDTDSNFFKRWDWVLDEMIFAFEKKLDGDWEDQFHTGEFDMKWKKTTNGFSEMYYGPNHTHVFDSEGYKVAKNRISNGFRLFGKYYEGLWD